ncbi:tRNA-methyltransferase [Haematococcus lacustris]
MEGGPVNHSLFNSTFTVPALRVPKRQCADLMKQLRGYTLERPKIRCVVGDGQELDTRLLLLEPYADDVGLPEPVQQAASKHGLALTSYDLPLSYEQHNVDQVLKKLLPAGVDAPASFETVGHIIHLNLREEQLPYRYLIGQVLLDKNPHIRTTMAVQVGAIDNEFRVFSMELLAGQPSTETEVVQHGMRFRLDFAQVYWNSRLEAEHQRLVARHFRPGQVVVDVMAGVGPFAVPAAQAGCTVYANDLNPSSARYMAANARLNHLSGSIHVFNMDGRDFVRLLKALPSMPAPIPDNFQVTPGGVIFQHAVMNLPATAVQFLDAFRGALDPQRWEGSLLPMVHVYTFKTAAETDADILAKVELHLGGPLDSAPEVVNVRDVAPNKLMLCVSFQLPAAVAFMGRPALQQDVDGAAGDTATKRQKLEG